MAYLKKTYLSARNKIHHFFRASAFSIINYVEYRNTLRWDSWRDERVSFLKIFQKANVFEKSARFSCGFEVASRF